MKQLGWTIDTDFNNGWGLRKSKDTNAESTFGTGKNTVGGILKFNFGVAYNWKTTDNIPIIYIYIYI